MSQHASPSSRATLRMQVVAFSCALAFLAPGPRPVAAGQLAFPGAEGEGRFTAGGRGGDVYHVTNLNDAGPGSLRAGLDSAEGPRTIVFDLAGTLALESALRVRRSRLTIAGQTAPGRGIAIINYGLSIGAPQVIVRHVRVRPGDARQGPGRQGGFGGDAISISAGDVILDHVSTSWAIDENLSVSGDGPQRVTVQYSTISECLDQTGLWHGVRKDDYGPGGPKGHSMGSLIKPGRGDGVVSFHHNLWSNNANRNPAVGNYDRQYSLTADLRNNVLYNNRAHGYSSGESRRVRLNYVGNTIIAGPATSDANAGVAFRAHAANRVHVYLADNLLDDDRDASFDPRDRGFAIVSGTYDKADAPFPLAPVTTEPAEAAFAKVLAGAGAFPWKRDSVDERLAAEVRAQRGRIIDSQNEVGGYPQLPEVARPADWDTDGDGMPDDWESRNRLNPAVPDHNGDADGDGYTNLEEYLHEAASRP